MDHVLINLPQATPFQFFRSALVDKAFSGMPKVEVDLFDLEQNAFTRTYDLEKRYEAFGEVWHVVGGDLVIRGEEGKISHPEIMASGGGTLGKFTICCHFKRGI